MKKLLYITNGINGSGGLERVLAVKASYLADALGYKVSILTLNNGHKQPFYEFSSNIKFHDIKVEGNAINYFLSYKNGIKKVLKIVKPNVISVCDDGLKGLLFPILFGKDIPVIYERHASLTFNFIGSENKSLFIKIKNYFKKQLMAFGAKRFNAFVVLSKGNKNDWKGVSCTVISNPLPFKNSIKSTKATRKNLVLAVGSQSYNKGYDRLIEVWDIVTKKYPNWQLEVYGKKNKNLNLQYTVDKLGFSSSLTFNKPIKNIANKYKEASIFVLPSRSEGFGMVLLEAMSFGLPCIAFNCPHGPADIISEGGDGFLIENGDILGFANAIIKLIENKENRVYMGNVAKENVGSYTLEKILPQWDNLFKSLEKK